MLSYYYRMSVLIKFSPDTPCTSLEWAFSARLRARQGTTGSIAQHYTAQRSAAQRSAAQHSAGAMQQHSTAHAASQ